MKFYPKWSLFSEQVTNIHNKLENIHNQNCIYNDTYFQQLATKVDRWKETADGEMSAQTS